jgi:hypothetical protein
MPSRTRSGARPCAITVARALGPWPKKTSTRPSASRISALRGRPGQRYWLCSLATSGMPAGAARAAAHQAPNMCAWTRSAAASLGPSHAAKRGSGTHCRFPRSPQISGSAPCRRASSMPPGVAQPQCRTEAIPWPRSSRITRSIDSWAPPGSSLAMTRATNTIARLLAGGPRSRVNVLGPRQPQPPPLGYATELCVHARKQRGPPAAPDPEDPISVPILCRPQLQDAVAVGAPPAAPDTTRVPPARTRSRSPTGWCGPEGRPYGTGPEQLVRACRSDAVGVRRA